MKYAEKSLSRIVIRDDEFRFVEPEELSSVNLLFSKDKVYFQRKKTDYIENNKAFLNDYSGSIVIPKTVSLDYDSNVDLKGVIASPAHISGNGNLNLIIYNEFEGNLCIRTGGTLRVNNKLIFKGTIEEQLGYYGEYFENYEKKFIKKYSESLNEPKIIKTKHAIAADFFGAEFLEVKPIEVCEYDNIILIDKPSGAINLYVTEYYYDIILSQKKIDKKLKKNEEIKNLKSQDNIENFESQNSENNKKDSKNTN